LSGGTVVGKKGKDKGKDKGNKGKGKVKDKGKGAESAVGGSTVGGSAVGVSGVGAVCVPVLVPVRSAGVVGGAPFSLVSPPKAVTDRPVSGGKTATILQQVRDSTSGASGASGVSGASSGASSVTGRGKTGKGLIRYSAKRHRKVLKDNIKGITKPAIRRLARRGGVKRISGVVYEETRWQVKDWLTMILKDTVTYTEHAGHKTVEAADVVTALKFNDKTMYGSCR